MHHIVFTFFFQDLRLSTKRLLQHSLLDLPNATFNSWHEATNHPKLSRIFGSLRSLVEYP